MSGPKFGGAKWRAGDGQNRSRTVRLIRRAMTTVTNKYGVGGVEKTREKPRPITLATTPWKDDGR